MRILTAILFSILLVQSSFGAVAASYSGTPNVSAAATGTSLNLTTLTVTAGSNLCLIAFLYTNSSITNPAINWDSTGTPQAMTASTSTTNSGGRRIQVFYLVAPTAGNKTLAASWTTSRTSILAAAAFSGADQTTCVNTADNATGGATSTAPAQTVTSTTNGATVVGLIDSSTTMSSTDTQTSVFINAVDSGVSLRAAMSYGLGGTSNTHNWTIVSGAWATLGVHILGAAGCGKLPLLGAGC